MSGPSPDQLAQALASLRGRESQLLEWAFVDGTSTGELAGFLGVRSRALELSLLRAAERFAACFPPEGQGRPAAPTGGAEGSLGADDEPARARALAQWLDTGRDREAGQKDAHPALLGFDAALAPAHLLRTGAPEVRRALERARSSQEAGPGARRTERLRRLLLLALVLGTLYLYWRGGR